MRLWVLAIFFCSGCMSIPIPPGGENPGQYGYIDISVKFRPNFDSVMNAFRREEPKPTSSK